MTNKTEIVNAHMQIAAAGGNGVIIAFNSRHSVIPARWSVSRLVNGRDMRTADANAAWYEHGRKSFWPHNFGDRWKALDAAKAWVAEQGWYEGPWARNKLGQYVPKAINDAFPLRQKPKRVL